MYADDMTWDLNALYKNEEVWEEDFKKIVPASDKFNSYRNKLNESPAMLKEAIIALDEFERLVEKIYTFAHLRSDENTTINSNRSKVDRVETLLAELSGNSAWFEPEIMAIDDKKMEEFLNSEELSFYRRSLLELLKEKPHTLTESEERIIGMLGDVTSSSDRIFEVLNDADLDFGKVKDAKGKLSDVTHGSYRKFLESNDRKVRENAFKKVFSTYNKFRNTFASTLSGTVKRHVVSAKLRKYPSALMQSLQKDDIPEKVYLNLINTVNNNLDGLHKYMAFRAKSLNLKQLDMYDLYNPLVDNCRREYSLNDGIELLYKALAPLGDEYLHDMKQAFEQRWVDVPERKGKRSGAYSSGCYDSYPYMLLNFNSTLNDVFTLAHELGHSMHSYYSHKHQHYHYASYNIFAAEVASTTNEMLLFDYLLNNTDDKKLKSFLLTQQLDDIRATLHRQTMFAEFELQIHQAAENQIPLNADYLCENYYKLNQKYYGSSVKGNKLIEMEWARIPHFYYNFYVYKYSTGVSAAIKFASRLKSGDDNAQEKYLGFLKAGGSLPVLETLNNAGVDLESSAPIEAALDYFDLLRQRLETEFTSIN